MAEQTHTLILELELRQLVSKLPLRTGFCTVSDPAATSAGRRVLLRGGPSSSPSDRVLLLFVPLFLCPARSTASTSAQAHHGFAQTQRTRLTFTRLRSGFHPHLARFSVLSHLLRVNQPCHLPVMVSRLYFGGRHHQQVCAGPFECGGLRWTATRVRPSLLSFTLQLDTLVHATRLLGTAHIQLTNAAARWKTPDNVFRKAFRLTAIPTVIKVEAGTQQELLDQVRTSCGC